jgi:hypothetical protein
MRLASCALLAASRFLHIRKACHELKRSLRQHLSRAHERERFCWREKRQRAQIYIQIKKANERGAPTSDLPPFILKSHGTYTKLLHRHYLHRVIGELDACAMLML